MKMRFSRSRARLWGTLAVSALGLMIGAAATGAPSRSLFADVKASQVGDTVTILVIESTQASRSASTQTSKKDSLGLSGGFDNATKNTKISGAGTTSADHNGSGITKSSGQLRTTVTALVTEVLPNGYLKLEGSRKLTINNEKETLTVSGIARIVDVSRDNTIFSTQLANAEISYTGDGWIAKQQRPSLLLRILAGILPFF